MIEVRKGPSRKFLIEKTLVRKNTLLVELEVTRYWKKVYIPELNISGWVHTKLIKKALSHFPQNIKIPISQLPSGFAKKEINSFYNNLAPFFVARLFTLIL